MKLHCLLSVSLACLAAGARTAPVSQDAASSSPRASGRRTVAIVVFPGVELLDFAGPGEVFAAAQLPGGPAFKVLTVAESKAPVTSQGFVTITPQHTFADCPATDVVVVPGGSVPVRNQALREFVLERSEKAELMMSVCNGALVYAAAGMLEDLEATTHHSALQELALLEPSARVFTNRRFVDNGHVLTSAGVSAGIDGALHAVARLCGEEVAWRTARYMEYDWRPDEIAKLHAQPGAPVDEADSLRWAAAIRRAGVAGALQELRASPQPPTEKQLVDWSAGLVRTGKLEDGIALLQLTVQAFPTSPSAHNGLSEALEAKGDAPAAMQAARSSLELLERDPQIAENVRQRLRNAAASRVARLSGKGDLPYVCPPCGSSCDERSYVEGGPCPGCSMELVARKP
jgi:putative intracellular protease/amidase